MPKLISRKICEVEEKYVPEFPHCVEIFPPQRFYVKSILTNLGLIFIFFAALDNCKNTSKSKSQKMILRKI